MRHARPPPPRSVCFVCFFGVVIPLQKLLAHVYKGRFDTKKCPECCEKIPVPARKCKFCCSEQPVAE